MTLKNIKRNLSKERAIAIAEKRKEQTELAKKLMYTIADIHESVRNGEINPKGTPKDQKTNVSDLIEETIYNSGVDKNNPYMDTILGATGTYVWK